MHIDQLLSAMDQDDASDLYLKEGNRPFLRTRGQLVPQGEDRLAHTEVEQLAQDLMGPERTTALRAQLEMNFAFERSGLGRFRANVLFQQGKLALVIRRIQRVVRTFEELALPARVLRDLVMQPKGLLLVTGATSQGKSTTIASMVDYINHHMCKHIVTLEDPVEFVFQEDQSLINQREIGADTRSFEHALKNILRQSSDIIYLSDIRDTETMASAVMAAEAGNLVLSCLHSVNVINTIERMVAFFPPYQQGQVRLRLSTVLQGIVSIRLVARLDGTGRVPACEVLVATPTVRELIREGRASELYPYMEDGGMFGMQSFHQSLAQLVQHGLVTTDAAKRHADSPDELALRLKHVQPTKTASDTPFDE
jgi:twitching motility protein PilT